MLQPCDAGGLDSSPTVAAEKLGLDLVWRGCDIDPEYAEQTGQG